MLVTISRQFGAGGSSVAELVAQRLGWSLVDNDLIDRVAARAGLTPKEVAEQEETAPGLLEKIVTALAASSQEILTPASAESLKPMEEPRLVQVTEKVVEELAAQGRVVLVGRAATAVLAGTHDAIHVRLVAAKGHRIGVVAAREGIDAAAAEAAIDKTDANRARYHREYYRRDWSDPAQYHVTLNTGILGYDAAADLIVSRARQLGWVG
ncbi:MAG TPA: cytidylate kinase-like family protein [Gemmatimonadales bacterium]|jgi:cytidylate kinase|nr:cytidylate kinase-like family protein [Gemmatimonadales bacterium]